jgi:serine phosphatase RsbU (regulator of sigma subunit)
VEPHEAGHRLTWSNAGHLPPLLLPPDGRACLLEREPDLLLGVEPTTTRQDHTVLLPRGSTVLLYTDGLVERRGTSLVDDLARLVDVAGRLGGEPVEDLCDGLLRLLAADAGEDDIALLALRT